ncbi:MAG: [ribosomal protein S18]-alanine N-acetyltransferase [Thermoleophilaceae bacterium]|jgi:GNAT superfamily N-acetyltransferase|nr:[ribosomal protein S18]-alanine N-acetyltransferase [Thermoleophilaceae bacterium]
MTPIRPAEARDLEAIVTFEIEIARISFGDEAVLDPEVHSRRVVKAIDDPGEGTFVAGDDAHGWLWVSSRKNFLTGEEYGFLRSLAVAPSHIGTSLGEELLAAGVEWARARGAREVTGKVHVDNVSMRTVYRGGGFSPQHLTMRLEL